MTRPRRYLFAAFLLIQAAPLLVLAVQEWGL
jgi:hypothetical protein